ncbi:MAG TPA: 4a-hydroxytetrahydrobiopterin dehydratase [Gemmatimonadaceae bacterium]|nr:4a-hydroxytetrahydrobiopterin dehydratase [Gemmatimonadaceae bacterium]
MSSSERVYTAELLAKVVPGLPAWRADGGAIVREFATDGWSTTIMLVNAIAYYAEAADHHPDLEVSWARVRVTLSTHSAGGVTDKDLALARQIEETALWRPAAGSPLRGTTRAWIRNPES